MSVSDVSQWAVYMSVSDVSQWAVYVSVSDVSQWAVYVSEYDVYKWHKSSSYNTSLAVIFLSCLTHNPCLPLILGIIHYPTCTNPRPVWQCL